MVQAVRGWSVNRKRLATPDLESRIAARAGLPNPERHSCREEFYARLVTELKPNLPGASQRFFSIGHASRSRSLHFHLLCRAKKSPAIARTRSPAVETQRFRNCSNALTGTRGRSRCCRRSRSGCWLNSRGGRRPGSSSSCWSCCRSSSSGSRGGRRWRSRRCRRGRASSRGEHSHIIDVLFVPADRVRVDVEGRGICHIPSGSVRNDGDVIAYLVILWKA